MLRPSGSELLRFKDLRSLDLITEFDFLPNCTRFPWNICNGCGMPTEDAYSSGHLVLSHFGTCMCSNVETNLSWACLVSGLLNFEHPSVLLFCLTNNQRGRGSGPSLFWGGLDKSRHIHRKMCNMGKTCFFKHMINVRLTLRKRF